MKFHKFHNKHLGDYHTFDVNDVYEAIYAAKYPSTVFKTRDDLSESKLAVSKMQLLKAQEKKTNFMEMLLKNKVQVIEPNIPIVQGFSYIRYQNNRWKPVFLSSIKEGGEVKCDHKLVEQCKALLGEDLEKCMKECTTDAAADTQQTTADTQQTTTDTQQTTAEATEEEEADTQQTTTKAEAEAIQVQLHHLEKVIEYENDSSNESFIKQLVEKSTSNIYTKQATNKQAKDKLYFVIKHFFPKKTTVAKTAEVAAVVAATEAKAAEAEAAAAKAVEAEAAAVAATEAKAAEAEAAAVAIAEAVAETEAAAEEAEAAAAATATEAEVAEAASAVAEAAVAEAAAVEAAVIEAAAAEAVAAEAATKAKNVRKEAHKLRKNVELKRLVIHTAIQVKKYGWKYIHDALPSSQFLNYVLYKKQNQQKKEQKGGGESSSDNNSSEEDSSDDESVTWDKLIAEIDSGEEFLIHEEEENLHKELLQNIDGELNGTSESKTNIFKFFKYIASFVFVIFIFRQLSSLTLTPVIKDFDDVRNINLSQQGSIINYDNNPYYTNRPLVISNLNYETQSSLKGRKILYDSQKTNEIMYSFKVEQLDDKCSDMLKLEQLVQSIKKTHEPFPPKCTLMTDANTLPFSQQLLLHRDNLIVHFIDMMNHINMWAEKYIPSNENETFFKDIHNLKIYAQVKEILFDSNGANITNYKDLIKNNLGDNLVNDFQSFTTTYNTIPKVRGFFRNYFKYIEKDVDQPFIDRMNYFENVLVQHIKNYENGIEFKNHICKMGSYNEITTILPILSATQVAALQQDNIKSAENAIAKIKELLIPQVEAILRMYYDLYISQDNTNFNIETKDLKKMKIGYNDENKINRYIIDFSPQFKPINNELDSLLMEINEKKTILKNDLLVIFSNILKRLEDVNEHWKQMVEKFKSNIVLGKYVNNINILLGNRVSQAELITQEMFHRFQMFALNEANSVPNNFIPNYFYTLNDVSSMIVKKINDNIFTDSDKTTVRYVVANQISSLIYEIYPDSFDNLVNIVTDMPGIKQTYSFGKALFHIYSGEQYENYIKIGESAMLSLNAERQNIEDRINRGFVGTNDIFKTTLKTVQSIITNNEGGASILKNVAQNFSNDFIRLKIELVKIELALILLHLQNDILKLKDTDNSVLPSKTDYSDKFLNKYHPEKKEYINRIVQKNLILMALLKIERDGYANSLVLPTIKGGNITSGETQLVDSFISNAKVHNKMVLGNINDFGDINDKLKKRLIKSFIKNNKNHSKTIKKIKSFERRYNMRKRGDDFLGM